MREFIKKIKHRKLVLLFGDVAVSVCIGLIFLAIGNKNISYTFGLLLLFALVYAARIALHTYRQVWRYGSAREFLRIIIADLLGGGAYLLVSYYIPIREIKLDLWFAMSIVAVSCIASMGERFLYQCIYRIENRTEAASAQNSVEKNGEKDTVPKQNVAIVGAGSNGFFLARELQMNKKSLYKPCCFIDNDKEKIGNVMYGLKVYSEEKSIEILRKLGIEDVIIAISEISGVRRRELFDFYSQSGFRVKIYELPFVDSCNNGNYFGTEYDTSKKPIVREFKLEDLLFREPIKINNKKTKSYYKDKVIMITGGGGSIGSEICRQLAKFGPKKLVVFDIYENNAYDIQQELKNKYGDGLDVSVEISSVREARRVDEVMKQYCPDIVVHAAAHKHVPLMEHNCAEAVKNNVFGTYNVVEAAEKYGVKKFIMISTDKAVNPTNVMGATKRMCEMIVQSRKDRAGKGTDFTAVRFGNVLGSNGSVIPLFKRQIAAGGPVTITDFRIIRYFMTIAEAAQLVLEAGAMAKNGELFVLDMGKPVKILKLAEDMIRLSGFEPYKDIAIKEIGLRAGEKLYEELLVKTEELDKTENDMIFIERDHALSRSEVADKLDILKNAVEDGSPEAIKIAMREAVPTYHDPKEVNQTAEQAQEMREASSAAV